VIARIGRWEIDCDPLQTAACYAKDVEWTPCECTDCRNFYAVSNLAFTKEFRDFANSLGIDISKPAEIWHYRSSDESCNTNGWFHFVGTLRSEHDAWVSPNTSQLDSEPAFGLKDIGFTTKIALLPDSFEGYPIVQLEFETVVPWVLEEQ
jgi:hypothetical protein